MDLSLVLVEQVIVLMSVKNIKQPVPLSDFDLKHTEKREPPSTTLVSIQPVGFTFVQKHFLLM